MRALILAPAVVALLVGTAAATPLGSSDVPGLIREYNAANEVCRSTDGTRKTEIACERRAAYTIRLNEVGWCHGKHDQGGAQMVWHRCTADSNRYGDD